MPQRFYSSRYSVLSVFFSEGAAKCFSPQFKTLQQTYTFHGFGLQMLSSLANKWSKNMNNNPLPVCHLPSQMQSSISKNYFIFTQRKRLNTAYLFNQALGMSVKIMLLASTFQKKVCYQQNCNGLQDRSGFCGKHDILQNPSRIPQGILLLDEGTCFPFFS